METDEGITGYGESFRGPGLTAAIRDFSTILIGEDPTSFDRVLRRLKSSTIYASPGLIYHAIGGLETALLDVIGKKFGLPIGSCLGVSIATPSEFMLTAMQAMRLRAYPACSCRGLRIGCAPGCRRGAQERRRA